MFNIRGSNCKIHNGSENKQQLVDTFPYSFNIIKKPTNKKVNSNNEVGLICNIS